jgi:hypothetical protein
MRYLFFSGRLVLATIAAAMAATSGAAPAKADSSTYASLAAGLKASVDSTSSRTEYFNFYAIREAYADSPTYDPYGTLVELHRVEMLRAYQHRDLKVAISEADKVLDQNYADIGAHVVEEMAYSDLGDEVHARFHRMLAREFLLSILRTGDGKSPGTAFQIVSVPEEYAVLNAQQIQFDHQTYQTVAGENFDKVVGYDPAQARKVTIYFYVDRMMDWANRMFSPQFRHLQAHGGPPDSAMASAAAVLSAQPTAPPPTQP